MQQLAATLDQMKGVFTAELRAPDGTLLDQASGTSQSKHMDAGPPEATAGQ
jgi:hypothetical protein